MSLRIKGATSVQFASSLDNYRLRPAVRTASGAWKVTVPADREFRYFYLVDGKPFLPDCQRLERDDFGSENCIHAPAP